MRQLAFRSGPIERVAATAVAGSLIAFTAGTATYVAASASSPAPVARSSQAAALKPAALGAAPLTQAKVDPHRGASTPPPAAERASRDQARVPLAVVPDASGPLNAGPAAFAAAPVATAPVAVAPVAVAPVAVAPARPAAVPAAFGDPRAIAQQMLTSRGEGGQFSCLDALWNRESGWSVSASNASGAYGIPQALPGSKMSSAGADWASNPATQISWGLGYIDSTYGSPCAAYSHSQANGWY